jgi:hypothetical protein
VSKHEKYNRQGHKRGRHDTPPPSGKAPRPDLAPQWRGALPAGASPAGGCAALLAWLLLACLLTNAAACVKSRPPAERPRPQLIQPRP